MDNLHNAVVKLYDVTPSTAKRWIAFFKKRVVGTAFTPEKFADENDLLAYFACVVGKKPSTVDNVSEAITDLVEHIACSDNIAFSDTRFHVEGGNFEALRDIQNGATFNVIMLIQDVFTGKTSKRGLVQQYLRDAKGRWRLDFHVVSFLGWLWTDKATLKRIVESLKVDKQLRLSEDLRKDLGITITLSRDYSSVVNRVKELTKYTEKHLNILLKMDDIKGPMEAFQGCVCPFHACTCVYLCVPVCTCTYL
jgi:hypothetical protein